MPHRQEKPRLNKGQYYELQAQYERTPNPREGFSASGEHYALMALLNSFGFYPNSREAAYDLTEELLEEGYYD